MFYPLPRLRDGRAPVVSSGFGPRSESPGEDNFHAGVDLCYLAAPGDPPYPGHYTEARAPRHYMPKDVPVLAVADGEVRWIHTGRYGGKDMRIAHGGPQANYIHLARAVVQEGQRVKAGQVLGYAGPPEGSGRFRHLHFEWLPAADRVDPAPYLAEASILSWPGIGVLGLLALGGLVYVGWRHFRRR